MQIAGAVLEFVVQRTGAAFNILGPPSAHIGDGVKCFIGRIADEEAGAKIDVFHDQIFPTKLGGNRWMERG
ncbi:hypothetical protein MKQ70_03625 [Chitinophaga sedimenti]|uniref:hypothetical protein n=1 Tax=Chitinophaga sedimenti TaxID=2033606 RepID=UPI002004465C|nr:hypothetical protein [Chitinophaga sedimenti]MCK7554145.1 hypothetical protein [Chitinophaga sedimenti]